MADYRHPRRKSTSLRLSIDSIPPQLPLYSSPPQTDAAWDRFGQDPPFVDEPPDYPESSEEADESDQEVPIHKRRQFSPQFYVSPFQSSPRKTRRSPHQFHSLSPSLTSYRPRQYARNLASQHATTSSDAYLDSLLARSVHALEVSNTLLQSSIATKSSMTAVLSTDSPADDSLEESATGLSKRVMKNKYLQKSWIDDLEEIGKRVDNLFGEQTEIEDGPSPRHGQESQIPTKLSSPDATSPISQSLPTSSTLPPMLAERRRGQNSPPLTLATPTSEGQLNYSAHNRSHFVAPPPRALTVYIGSDDTDPDAIKLPPTLGIRSPPQPVQSHSFQSAVSSPSPSPVLSRRTSFSNGQSVGNRTSELLATVRAYDILSSYVTPQHGTNKITRTQSLGSNTSPIRPGSVGRTQASPARSEGSNIPTTPKTSRGRSLTPLRTLRLDSQSNSPVLPPKPLTPPIEELSSANSSSESDTQTNFAVTSLRKIFMDDQALVIEREKQLSVSRSLSTSTSGSRMRPPPRLLVPSTLPEASTSHATASVTRLLTKNKHSSSTRPPSPPRQSSLRSPSRRSPTLSPAKNSPGPSPSPSLLSIPSFFVGGSGGSNNGSGRSTPNRVSFAALPESYANSKPGGPDEQFNRERRRERRKSRSQTPSNTRPRSRSLENDSDEGGGWGWWTSWLLAVSNADSMELRLDQEARIEERVARWGVRPSPI
ncbi:hypothetical protein BDM02DRAFT_3184228 [Thelephora ganbajun]|uniref:Uncharacterized protein n=1 Tax=Thelephora ganbajun TaxID=370292 RepID=A0ACB6ZQB7_THEGA|nr:hypothetical protein BDM02DRAFT_3184228 [Thelephora ganbajun]